MPDGRIIYFDGKSKSLVVVNVDGSNLRNTGLPTGLPCVFPDGKRVAVLRDRNGDGSVRAIFMGRLFQPGVKRITPWEGIADKIDCSPDGTRVAFSTPSFDQGGSNVYVVRTDGTGLVQLTHDTDGTINNGIDSWSPDGKKIVFLSNRGGSYRLHTMNADGSDIAPLPNVQSGGHLAAWGTRH
jgi:TolB protein